MIEIATSDNLEYKFYPVTGNAFTFKVRAPKDAHLALVSTPVDSEPIYEIFIGGWDNSKSVIRKDHQRPDVAEVATPNILSDGEFRGFWVRWYDNVITVGREGEIEAFLAYNAGSIFAINYIGICTGWGAEGLWQIEGGPGVWVAASNGDIPPGAMPAGSDNGEDLFIARATHENDLVPGKLHPSHGSCYVAYDGAEHAHTDYEVLCGGSGQWIAVDDAGIPPNAVPAGKTADGEPLFIGRVNHEGASVFGKVQPSHGCCYIPYGGEELSYKEFEIYTFN